MRKSQVRYRKGFTLIELLTVIAITAILLTIIILPIFQSFNLTRAAQAYSDAQDKARVLIEKIQREINNGVTVRDNSGSKGSIALVVPSNPNGNPGDSVITTIPNLKLDIVRPAQGDPSLKGASGGFLVPIYDAQGNFVKYIEDPTLKSPRGQVVLPVAPGVTSVRYFVGLARPVVLNGNGDPAFAGVYSNPYDGLLMRRTGGRDNLFVLYRVEYQARVWDANANGPGVGAYVPNTRLFEVDANGEPILDDPLFFTLVPTVDYDPLNQNQLTAAGLVKARRIVNWTKSATIQTEVSRYDMILPIYDKASRLVAHDLRTDPSDTWAPALKDRPRIMPLIQLKPTRVSGEMAEGKMASRLGEEMENARETGPDMLYTRLGAWTNANVRVYPSGWLRSDMARNEYVVARIDPADNHIKIYEFDPDSGAIDSVGGTAIFDVTAYNNQIAALAANPALSGPFTAALQPGATATLAARNLFMAFLPDTGVGRVVASFGIDTVKGPGVLPVGVTVNQPEAFSGDEISPSTPDARNTEPWNTNASRNEINIRFNRLWNDPALLGFRPDKVHRYIDLRVTPQIDGSPSPLDPSIGFGRAKIVPGSEVVIAPDQNPGPNYGNPVRYTRTTRAPGPNQYKINYVDLREPVYGNYGLANPPANYDPNDFVSAVFQPRFKVGYIQLNSDPTVPLPRGNFRVYYRFQFTGGRSAASLASIDAPAPNAGAPQDAFAVDYDTRQLMTILLTIRNYPQSDLPNPQTVTLSATAKVRNYLR